MKNGQKIVSLFVCLIFFLLFPFSPAEGKTLEPSWRELETRYTIILYQSYEDLVTFNKKIKYTQVRWGLGSLVSGVKGNALEKKIIKKVDILYERVQDILGIHKKMDKGKIIIYPNRLQLNAAYAKISRKSNLAYSASSFPRAWYNYEQNTIFINIDDLHEGILAHEIAHFVIDHYVPTRLPKPAAEILAQYVDKHLLY